jgi:hypothetical protein
MKRRPVLSVHKQKADPGQDGRVVYGARWGFDIAVISDRLLSLQRDAFFYKKATWAFFWQTFSALNFAVRSNLDGRWMNEHRWLLAVRSKLT